MNYHNILHCNMNNGDGLRVVLFVSGCNHFCKKCQNPQTWEVSSGIMFDEEAIIEIENELSNDYCSGLTITGGDPLYPKNRPYIQNLCGHIKEKFPNKTIWVYTGYVWEEIINEPNVENILNNIDVLLDGLFDVSKISPDKKWVGSSNQRVINVQKSLKENKVVLWCD